MAKTPKPPTSTMPTDEQIDHAATVLLTWVRSLDPTYRSNIEAAMETYLWTDRQCLGAFIGYVLENDLYMQIPTNPAFEPGHVGSDGPTKCEACGTEFAVAFMGQRYCGNKCAIGKNGMPWVLTDSDNGRARCDYCNELFTMARKEQRFCSPACENAGQVQPIPPPQEESVQLPLDVARWDEV